MSAWQFVTSPGFGGVAAVLAAVIALVAAVVTSRRAAASAALDRSQREATDRRVQWWTRFTWAADRAVAPDTQEFGMFLLSELVGQGWTSDEDDALAVAAARVIDSSHRPERTTTSDGEDGGEHDRVQRAHEASGSAGHRAGRAEQGRAP